MNIQSFLNAPIYKNQVVGEVLPPENYPYFAGAWYYKVVSSKDHWIGMEATVTLPLFTGDETRRELIDTPQGAFERYMDTPSVYLGGSSDYETDIGFGFFRGLIGDTISEEKITFRPFWRTIYLENGKERNDYLGTKLNETEYYYFPGDTVKINLVSETENYLTLRIELLQETTIEKYVKIREANNRNQLLVVENIIAPGNGIRPTEYKRVNAIDQYHNEGKPTQMTSAKVDECVWKDVYLYRLIDSTLYKVPFNEKRIKRIFSPNQSAFHVSLEEKTETVTIEPKENKESQ